MFVFVCVCCANRQREEKEADWDNEEFVKDCEYLFGVFVYENGISFNVFQSASWRRWKAKALPKMPNIGKDKLSGKLLDQVSEDTDKMVETVEFLFLFFLFSFVYLYLCLFFVFFFEIGSIKWQDVINLLRRVSGRGERSNP